MGRVSEQVESLRIEITSNQNARTALASTHLDHRPKIANTDSHSTHTQHSPNIPRSPFPNKLYQSVAVKPNLCIANGSSVWVLR